MAVGAVWAARSQPRRVSSKPGVRRGAPLGSAVRRDGEGFLSQAAPCPGGAVKPRFFPATEPGNAPNDRLITDIRICMCTKPIFLFLVVTILHCCAELGTFEK